MTCDIYTYPFSRPALQSLRFHPSWLLIGRVKLRFPPRFRVSTRAPGQGEPSSASAGRVLLNRTLFLLRRTLSILGRRLGGGGSSNRPVLVSGCIHQQFPDFLLARLFDDDDSGRQEEATVRKNDGDGR